MSMQLVLKACCAVVLCALLFGAGTNNASAAIVFSQDFSVGIGSNEEVSGDFSVSGGRLVTSSPYTNGDFALYRINVTAGNLTGGTLAFDITYDTESGFDPLFVKVNGNAIATYGGTGSGRSTLSLGDVAGPVIIDFEFRSDNSVVGSGVQLDNIVVADSISSSVPEPSTWAMMLLGFAGLAFAADRKKSPAAGRKRNSTGAALTAA